MTAHNICFHREIRKKKKKISVEKSAFSGAMLVDHGTGSFFSPRL